MHLQYLRPFDQDEGEVLLEMFRPVFDHMHAAAVPSASPDGEERIFYRGFNPEEDYPAAQSHVGCDVNGYRIQALVLAGVSEDCPFITYLALACQNYAQQKVVIFLDYGGQSPVRFKYWKGGGWYPLLPRQEVKPFTLREFWWQTPPGRWLRNLAEI